MRMLCNAKIGLLIHNHDSFNGKEFNYEGNKNWVVGFSANFRTRV